MNGLPAPMRLPVPGPACGHYPQRAEAGHDAAMRSARWRAAAALLPGRARARSRFVAAVRAVEAGLAPFESQAAARQLRDLRARLGRDGFVEPLLVEAFAWVVRATRVVFDIELFDTQLIAARIMLDNRLAEMATGEGKTHAAMIAAATAALSGVPVHVITANPYLAGRDADRLSPLYRALGLSVAAIRPGDDDLTRRTTYACDIAYSTASDLIFDYLRDATPDSRIAAPSAAGVSGTAPTLLRGLCLAIVDEADGVLIDEARTPFILARERHDAAAQQRHGSAMQLALALRAGDHFTVDAGARRIHLLPAGQQHCADMAVSAAAGDALWTNRRFRNELVERALAALHLYRRDIDYVVRDRKSATGMIAEVAIVDPTTGRIAEGRRWSNGLHQMVELKEGCPLSPLQSVQARLTYQRFFTRYWCLGGMSGTLREARRELLNVYGLTVEVVPLRLPGRCRFEAPRIYADAATRWNAALVEVNAMRQTGRAVLIGTDSVADAQRLSERLQAAGVPHQCLDARQDAREADCIARAGAAGCVTVATNMAGRGTDIKLDPDVAARGGLHVVACQQNASARIDRQLHGRAARAGDSGSVSTLLSLDEGLIARSTPRVVAALFRMLATDARPLPAWLARSTLWLLQTREEQRARSMRARLLQSDRQMKRRLGFGARAE